MNRIATVIGWIFVIFWLLGSVIPGVSFHVYFGPTEGAKQWHSEQSG